LFSTFYFLVVFHDFRFVSIRRRFIVLHILDAAAQVEIESKV